ncbi:MAG: asparagine synthase (glutamine-hydrolyzing) [Acetobacteraceae bacterium]|nr:asparagine synthase (glutamine-hydrolyzing) [Acetobacteraceae bacterium]
MCGVAGVFDTVAARPIDPASLRRMTSVLRHRWPDGEGFHIEPGLGLGHRRLAIIDVAGGDQPMYNEDGSVVIVFNGEIYNHNELRPKLEAEGHVFRSRCDTEAIIHAWESWGPRCLDRLSGMFAFALWDRNRGQLFLARDRLGKKPLYCAMLDGRLVFASELQALTTLSELPRRLNPASIEDFFAFGYIPDPDTIYDGVQRLPAAHYLLLERGRAVPKPRCYWHVSLAPRQTNEAEAIGTLVPLLKRCIARRLIADVPLGAFLSGGVDSGAVVALAAGLHEGPLATFAIGFPGEADERPFAELVARRYATAHHADGTVVDYIEAAREQAAIFGEPFGDSSSVPTHRVAALARRHVTVALSGDGGDEIFAGYRRYQWHRLNEAIRSFVPGPVRRKVIGGLASAYPKLDRAPRWLRAKYTLTEISLDSALGYYRMLCKLHDQQRRAVFASSLRNELDGYDAAARVTALMDQANTDDSLLQAQYVDLHTWLPGDILVKADRASMANSLELRAPLLDPGLVEWAGGLAPSLKLRRRSGKLIFKQAMERYLPDAVLYRRKQGFAEPLATQFRDGAGRIRERLLGERMRDARLFDPAAIARMVDEHSCGRFDHSTPLWLLLVFEGFLAGESPGQTTSEARAPAAALAATGA